MVLGRATRRIRPDGQLEIAASFRGCEDSTATLACAQGQLLVPRAQSRVLVRRTSHRVPKGQQWSRSFLRPADLLVLGEGDKAREVGAEAGTPVLAKREETIPDAVRLLRGRDE